MLPRSREISRFTLPCATAAVCFALPGVAQARQAPTEAQMAASDAKIRSAAGVIDKEWAKVFATSGDLAAIFPIAHEWGMRCSTC